MCSGPILMTHVKPEHSLVLIVDISDDPPASSTKPRKHRYLKNHLRLSSDDPNKFPITIMTDIVGTAAAVLEIAGAAINTSTVLYETISTIRNAPREIHALSSDIQALDRLLRNLELSLQSPDTHRIIDQDEEVRRPMEGLKDIIEKCNCTCKAVEEKMRPYAQHGQFEDSSAPENNKRLASIQWFFKRRSIFTLVSDLQRTKFLFSDSMGSITLCVF